MVWAARGRGLDSRLRGNDGLDGDSVPLLKGEAGFRIAWSGQRGDGGLDSRVRGNDDSGAVACFTIVTKRF